MRRMLTRLIGQERSVENARTACVELSQRQREREAVEVFLARHVERVAAGAG